MRNIAKFFLASVIAVSVVASSARATIPLNKPQTFDSNADNWISDLGSVTVVQQSPGGAPSGSGGYLKVTFTYPFFPSALNPVINNTSTPYIGDWSVADALEFDFIAFNAVPALGDLSIRFTGTNGSVFAHNFDYTLAQLNTWVHYMIPLTASSWAIQSGPNDFATALGNVNAAQLDIEGDWTAGGTQVFGLDNWAYTIPEPGTVFMLGAALLGLATTFRKQIQDGISQLKKS